MADDFSLPGLGPQPLDPNVAVKAALDNGVAPDAIRSAYLSGVQANQDPWTPLKTLSEHPPDQPFDVNTAVSLALQKGIEPAKIKDAYLSSQANISDPWNSLRTISATPSLFESAKRGVKGELSAIGQTTQALSGQKPDEPPVGSDYEPTWSHPANKMVQGLAGSAGTMGVAGLGGWGGAAAGAAAGSVVPVIGTTVGAIVGGSLGAGVSAALENGYETLGPAYREALNSGATEDEAWQHAWTAAKTSGGFTGLSFAAFEAIPGAAQALKMMVRGVPSELKEAAAKTILDATGKPAESDSQVNTLAATNYLQQADPVAFKNLGTQIAAQSAIGGGEQATMNVENGQPIAQGVLGAAATGAVGTALPLGAHLIGGHLTRNISPTAWAEKSADEIAKGTTPEAVAQEATEQSKVTNPTTPQAIDGIQFPIEPRPDATGKIVLMDGNNKVIDANPPTNPLDRDQLIRFYTAKFEQTGQRAVEPEAPPATVEEAAGREGEKATEQGQQAQEHVANAETQGQAAADQGGAAEQHIEEQAQARDEAEEKAANPEPPTATAPTGPPKQARTAMAIVTDPNTAPGQLGFFSSNKNPDIRLAVAQHVNTKDTILEKLSGDKDPRVAGAAKATIEARKPQENPVTVTQIPEGTEEFGPVLPPEQGPPLPPEAKQETAPEPTAAPVPPVPVAAEVPADPTKMRYATNNATKDSYLQKLTNDPDPRVAEAARKNIESRQSAAEAPKPLTALDRAADPNTPANTLNLYAAHPDPAVKDAVINNTATKMETLAKLAADKNETIAARATDQLNARRAAGESIPLHMTHPVTPWNGHFMEFLRGPGKDIKTASEAAEKYVRYYGDKTGHEYLSVYDPKTDAVIHSSTSHLSDQVIPTKALRDQSKEAADWVMHHNHPGNSEKYKVPLSLADLGNTVAKAVRTIVAHMIDGDMTAARINEKYKTDAAARAALAGNSFNARDILKADYNALRNLAAKHFTDGVRTGDFTQLEADVHWQEVLNRALNEIGAIHYITSVHLPEKMHPMIDRFFDDIRKSSNSTPVFDKNSNTVRPDEGAKAITRDAQEASARRIGDGSNSASGVGDKASAGQRAGQTDLTPRLVEKAGAEGPDQVNPLYSRPSTITQDSWVEDLKDFSLGKVDTRTPWEKLKDWSGRQSFQKAVDFAYQKAIDSNHAGFVQAARIYQKLAQNAGKPISWQEAKRQAAQLPATMSAHKMMTIADRSGAFAKTAIERGGVPDIVLTPNGGFGVRIADTQGNAISDPHAKGLWDMPGLDQVKANGLYDDLQTYMMAKRNIRLTAENRGSFEKYFQRVGKSPQDVVDYYEQKYPFFKDAATSMDEYNTKILRFLVDSGVITPRAFGEWTQHQDYIPFYRRIETAMGGSETYGPAIGGKNMMSRLNIKQLQGSETERVDDFFTNHVRNLYSAIDAGLRNVAANRALDDAMLLGEAKLVGTPTRAQLRAGDIVTVRQGGDDVHYQIKDPLLHDSLTALDGSPLQGALRYLQIPAKVLRTLTVHSPGFILLAHPLRESVQSWVVSKENMLPVVNAISGWKNVLTKAPSTEAMRAYGAGPSNYGGVFDFNTTNAERLGNHLREQLTGPSQNIGGFRQNAMHAINTWWGRYEKLVEAADMGTRDAIYRANMNRTADPFEAAYASQDQAVNFSRSGSSQGIRALAAMVPFMNARLQGADVVGRALWGRGASVGSWLKGMALMGLTGALYGLNKGNPQYENAPDETKDLNWIVPMADGYNAEVPVPFEAGILFKTIPEHLLRYMNGEDRPDDLRHALVRSMFDIMRLDPVPQAVKPILDVARNRAALSGAPIESQSMQGLPPTERFTPGYTSEAAKAISHVPMIPDFQKGTLDQLSPAKIDYLLKAYFGAVGTSALALSDRVIRAAEPNAPSDLPPRPSDIPVINRILHDTSLRQSPQIEAFYDVRTEADQLEQAVNQFKKEGNQQEVAELTEPARNRMLLAMKPTINKLNTEMSIINRQEKLIYARPSNEMSGDDKLQAIRNLVAMKNAVASNINIIRDRLSSVQ